MLQTALRASGDAAGGRARLAWSALVFAALGLGPEALALDPNRALTQYVQNVWRVEEGLPHNSVRAVLQTRDGYIWLGTYAGLARFDGVRFKVFDNRNSVLESNEIRTLHQDGGGVLWVGTTAGGLYRLQGDQLQRADVRLASKTVNVVVSTADGALLVGTGNGLHRIANGKVERFTVEDGLCSNTIMALAVKPDGGVFVGTDSGLNLLESGRFSKWREPAHLQNGVNALLLDREGGLYAGGPRMLDRFDAAGRLTLSIPAPQEGIHALHQDRDGILWVGLYGSGIGRLENGALKAFGQEQGFLDRRAWSLASDREGALWIGTRGGLAQLRDGAAVSYSRAEGFAGDIARAVFQDRDGAFYFGFAGGVSRLASGRVENLDMGERLAGAVVRGILRDRQGRLWIGTDKGLAEEIGPNRFRVLAEREGLPLPTRFTYEDRRGRLWIASGPGLTLLENGRIYRPEMLGPLANSNIEALFEDRAGRLWIGTLNHGAWRLEGDRLERTPLLGLTSIGVRSFYEDAGGAFFVGTVGSGLFVRNTGPDFRRITTKEGLTDDSIWSLLDDAHGQIWMTSDRGVFRVPKRELLDFADSRIQAVRPSAIVGPTDGLKSRECNGGASPAGLIARDGRVVAPTGAGVAIIDPKRLEANALVPPVLIEEVVVDRVRLASSDPTRVPAGGRDTEIHYTGLSFMNPARLLFRYRLDGHDRDWTEAATRRVAYYGGLQPGGYLFRVTASNDGTAWSPREATLRLIVEPLWYQTWSFRVIALATVLGLLASGSAWRVRRLEARERELAGLVASRTEELDSRTRQLETANAALAELAITDDLTGIANHRRFREFLDREWLRCARAHEPISLLMCDIDDFKAYNDALGHQAGDECLREAARTLSTAVRRAADLAARCGGEEFAIVLPATASAGACAIAEAVRLALRERALPHPCSRAGGVVTMSIGVATRVPSTDTSVEDLIATADGALYAAKSAGRDRSRVG